MVAANVAGCAEPGPAEPLAAALPYSVAALQQVDVVAADPPTCLPEPLPAPLPLWHEIPRVEGGIVPRGTQHIEIAAVVGGVWTGFQVGSRIDDAPFLWSKSIDQGSVSLLREVQPDQHEEGGPRWTFAWRAQAFDGQDCTAGAHSGSFKVVVVAVVPNLVPA